jgi:DNA polymerase-3 subunit epsilon
VRHATRSGIGATPSGESENVGPTCDAEAMNTTPANFVVVDVETSGFDRASARVLSVAALTLTADCSIEHSMYTLLNPGVDPGPTDIHGLTPAMLAGQPCYADIAEHLAPLLRCRILVAHNAAFDYSFLAAEARRCDTELPVTSVLCTLELAALLDLGLGSLSLAALARHWNIPQARPHDALDDARVLAGVFKHALARAAELEITLPLRSPATLPPVLVHEAAA